MAYYTDPWEQPVSQMRRELMQYTDVALARQYRCSRTTIQRIRKVLGVAPQPLGRRVVLRETPEPSR